jgi:hypothetical protein
MRRIVLTLPLALAAASAGATTIQQDFDAAQALLDTVKSAEARAAFTALLARFPPASQSRAASLVRARLGNALLATGDAAAAEVALMAAIAGFSGNDAQTLEERGVALYDLGRAHEVQGKLDSAAKAYALVADAKLFPVDSPSDIGLRAALARTLIWSNPDAARRLLDGLLALPPEKFGRSKDGRALVQTLRGRVELNNNNPAEAKRWFTEAARTAGGAETQRVSVADVRIRGDLAIANYKLGRMDEVQKGIAFSGAGSLASEGLTTAAAMPLPACAPATALAPDAVAVVEFAIGDDGRVSTVTPIYASRGSGAAASGVADDGPEVQFPQAVHQWVWSTGNVAKLNAFWRQSVRVELRCFTSQDSSDLIARSFNADYIAWAGAKGIRPPPAWPDNDAAALPLIRAELARREINDGLQSIQLEPVVRTLAQNNAASDFERTTAFRRRVDLLLAATAPAAVTGYARMASIYWAAAHARSGGSAWAQMIRAALLPLVNEQDASGQGQTRIAMWMRLALAEASDKLREPGTARALLDPIAAAPETVLPAGDAIRTAALLRLSNIAAAAHDTESAARALAATGLSPEQCSLINVQPLPINASIGSHTFPSEAMRWGTGGFARIGHDITADGQPKNVRTIVAAPPFIFGPPTEKAIARFRYQPVFRPGSDVGCSGNSTTVLYRIAG